MVAVRIWESCCRLLLCWTRRAELVLGTTVEDARGVRQLHGVNHISQREVGQQGRVRIAVEYARISHS